MKRITILLLLVSIFNGCATKQDDHSSAIPTKHPDVSSEPILSEEIIEEDVEQTVTETSAPEITVTPTPTNTPTAEPTKQPEATKQPNPSVAPVSTKEPEPEKTPEVTVQPTVEPTPAPTPTSTPVPTPVSTPEPTPEPVVSQACPGGYNPDWACDVRIDKATPTKLFSVADYGSPEAAFAACDADGQATNEFNGQEVRAYGCSHRQETIMEFGVTQSTIQTLMAKS